MQARSEFQESPGSDNCRQAWTAFFKANCDALFQTALLLSADPDTAEAGVAATIDSVDISRAPKIDELSILQERVARQTIPNVRVVTSPQMAKARSMLQSGLWPVLQVEQSPRACFVLRTFLGYATSSCAQMLGMEETAVRTLLRLAILQLHDAVIRKDCVESPSNEMLSKSGDLTGHLVRPAISLPRG